MLWLAFEARQGAKRQGTPRDDVEGDTRIRLRRVRGFGRSNLKNGKNFLTVGPLQSPCGLVSGP
jgi:hypothetical protein